MIKEALQQVMAGQDLSFDVAKDTMNKIMNGEVAPIQMGGFLTALALKGETVEEILRADLTLEQEALPLLQDAIEHCEKVRDYISREIFEKILESEEEHVDFLETQFDMIERMGLQNYVQLQCEPAGE